MYIYIHIDYKIKGHNLIIRHSQKYSAEIIEGKVREEKKDKNVPCTSWKKKPNERGQKT